MAFAVGIVGVEDFRWVGDVPGYGSIAYNLANSGGNGWNGILLPLHRNVDLMLASDLYHELQGLGYNPVTVARRIPGGGYTQIVDIGGTIHYDFEIYPGQAYLIWVNAGGPWPVYTRRSHAIKPSDSRVPIEEQDVLGMPICAVIPLATEDGAQFDDITAVAKFGEQTFVCCVENGVVQVQFSNFDGIKSGDLVSIEITANNGAYTGTTTYAMPTVPVEYGKTVTLAKVKPAIPTEFALRGNVPNPFNPVTAIAYELPAAATCDLTVYNINGREIKTLVSGKVDAGYYKAVWDGTDNSGQTVPGGIYFYVLRAGDYTAKQKMVLAK
jgi:hypothetical protein